jgi:hypothetical protein
VTPVADASLRILGRLILSLGVIVAGCDASEARSDADGAAEPGGDLASHDTAADRDADTLDASDVEDVALEAPIDLAVETTSFCTGFESFCVTTCLSDTGVPSVCEGGQWTCPPGLMSAASCHGCLGYYPLGCACNEGIVTCADGGGQ